ncbi:right-handed parallel beta-helix repeat-containing protein [uncultured Clostridium sp.]|uniref:right-handed parallel beta-helix repeat-containing protein n=1 Tax=uncultured Clostridium sp. TaxID=59620 RepID=UPI00266F3418|nr:right-handed parallel beta-helix repeat-containing protein [uncultured Clostridium sp.]
MYVIESKRIKKYILFIYLIVIFIIAISTTLILKEKREVISSNTVKTSIEDVEVTFNEIIEYKVNLSNFNISNTGKNPEATSKGINKMLKEAKEKGCNKITMPFGEYLISENEPIIMVSNMILDLNGSTFKINSNGLQRYTVFNFTQCENSIVTNGIILGDKDTHDYESKKGSHEWTCGVIFNDCENIELKDITIKDFPGYGISSSLGENISNLVIGVTKDNLEKGNINAKGEFINDPETIRTMEPLDISEVGGQFELGYNKGYMGYPYIQSKTYDSYFYDENMNFISKQESCMQYKKIQIPDKVYYVKFVFHQQEVPVNGDTDFNSTTVFLTNYLSPYKIKISGCTIEGNISLGMGLCGGRNFIIENNIFKNNGGSSPGYTVDLEDGWEYMDGYLFKNNEFIENSNDVVICAGDNIIFEENKFTSTVYVWGRATNYSFINNNFKDIFMNINYEYSTDTVIQGNTYENCKIEIGSKNKEAKIEISNENLINTDINIMPEEAIIRDSIIKNDNENISIRGNYENCEISAKVAEIDSVNMIECTIKDISGNIKGSNKFTKCEIEKVSLNTTNNINEINIEQCNIKDLSILISTWGDRVKLNIINNEIEMNENSLISISAGKLELLNFNENKVNNLSDKYIFNLYDTEYNKPNGNAIISNNTFIQKTGYIFDGVKIDNGEFNLEQKNNKYEQCTFINPKYINNKYFNIKQ